jgi:hypothetical protein
VGGDEYQRRQDKAGHGCDTHGVRL